MVPLEIVYNFFRFEDARPEKNSRIQKFQNQNLNFRIFSQKDLYNKLHAPFAVKLNYREKNSYGHPQPKVGDSQEVFHRSLQGGK